MVHCYLQLSNISDINRAPCLLEITLLCSAAFLHSLICTSLLPRGLLLTHASAASLALRGTVEDTVIATEIIKIAEIVAGVIDVVELTNQTIFNNSARTDYHCYHPGNYHDHFTYQLSSGILPI